MRCSSRATVAARDGEACRRRRRRDAVAAGHGAGGDPTRARQVWSRDARDVLRVAVGDRARVRARAVGRGAGTGAGSRRGHRPAEGLGTDSSRQASVPAIGYRFKHVLTQEVSYDSLLEHQRQARCTSRSAAPSSARHAGLIDEQAALLAHHFARAEAWRDAVRYGRRAADRASALSQFADALATLDQRPRLARRACRTTSARDLLADVLLQQERCARRSDCGPAAGDRRRARSHTSRRAGCLSAARPGVPAEGDLLTLLKRFNAADRALSTALRSAAN